LKIKAENTFVCPDEPKLMLVPLTINIIPKMRKPESPRLYAQE
jgi:hypothetical protein